jgi:sugar phosphate isomerase/epimerase
MSELFNRLGEIAKKTGIKWGYHNHSAEFSYTLTDEQKAEAAKQPQQNQRRVPLGEQIMKLFLDYTDPECVMFELDVYWALMGQQDPCEWLKKYPNRFKLLHIKDKWIIGASGLLNWENIFNTAYENDIMGWYVEIEKNRDDSTTQFYAVEESAKFLKNAPFVK